MVIFRDDAEGKHRDDAAAPSLAIAGNHNQPAAEGSGSLSRSTGRSSQQAAFELYCHNFDDTLMAIRGCSCNLTVVNV